jgi:hypothetical protein
LCGNGKYAYVDIEESMLEVNLKNFNWIVCDPKNASEQNRMVSP